MSTERRPHLFADAPNCFGSRREFLQRVGGGFGGVALSALLAQEGLLAASGASRPRQPLEPQPGHFPAKARSVIWLFMNGGPSQVDTWDYKPALERYDGKKLDGFDTKTGFFPEQVGPLLKSPFEFRRYGASGTWVPEVFPSIAPHVDDMAFIHSCFTETNNHSPALFQINTGMSRMGFPCLGAWVTYGLGTENQNLPAFVVMYDTPGRGLPKGYALNWGAGFLPGVYQGTALKGQGAPIENLYRRQNFTRQQQRRQVDLLTRLNKDHFERHRGETELSTRVESFELAYRMQMAAPEALAVVDESESTRRLYGLDNEKCSHFGKQCLMARRMVERGVRCVQIYSGGNANANSWDGHGNIEKNHRQFAGETDVPIGGLLTDLKQRGLLESTLVIWAGEFGRLPVAQRSKDSKARGGRDHNPHAFTTWMAGGGVKGGVHHGETDELGHKAAIDPVSVNDLHATILHLLGMNHEQLTYRYNGRDFRLTDVAGHVVQEVLA